jgi:putative DNA-invertase from lambdoid prophage Rac
MRINCCQNLSSRVCEATRTARGASRPTASICVALVVPGQGIDTSEGNPAGRLQLHVLCAVAEFEREVIRERVNAGLTAARAKGIRLGRPPTLEAHRAEVARLRSEGLTGRAIAEKLGIPASSAFKLIGESANQ